MTMDVRLSGVGIVPFGKRTEAVDDLGVTAGESAALANCALLGTAARARIATRTCEGRPLAGAGVNWKSVSDKPRPPRAAASFGSALAGVKEEIGSKLSDTAGGRFLTVVAANAGVSTRPAAASAATTFASFRCASFSKSVNSLFTSRYSQSKLKVP